MEGDRVGFLLLVVGLVFRIPWYGDGYSYGMVYCLFLLRFFLPRSVSFFL